MTEPGRSLSSEEQAIRQQALEDAASWVWEVHPGGSARHNISGHIRWKAARERGQTTPAAPPEVQP